MDVKLNAYKEKRQTMSLARVVGICAALIMIILLIISIAVSNMVYFLLGLAACIASVIFSSLASSRLKSVEKVLVQEIFDQSASVEEAMRAMHSAGFPKAAITKFLSVELSDRTYEQHPSTEAYDNACYACAETLKHANKPNRANTVEVIEAAGIFPDLKSYQYMVEWEIWRTDDKLYLYCPEVESYPSSFNDAPYAIFVALSDIQYFKEEGSVTNQTKITGGTIKQDRKTGRLSQTPIQSKTVEHDGRKVVLTLTVDALIMKVEFTHSAYDVLFSLIPEKEFDTVKASR